MQALRFSTCMAQNMDAACQAVAAYLSRRLDCLVEFVDDVPWQERELRFDRDYDLIRGMQQMACVREAGSGLPQSFHLAG